jgi:tight adherence protein B
VTTVVILSLALLRGAPVGFVVLIAGAIWRPWWFLAGIAGWTALHHLRRPGGPGPGDEADFLRGVTAELAGGASLRAAVVAAADRNPDLELRRTVRLAQAGFSADRIGAELAGALPCNGRAAASAFRLAATTGGETAGIMTTLAARADEVGALARERRALTAQARLSAWVVGGAPLVLLGVLAVAGRLGGLVGDPVGRMVLGVGLALELAGALAVVLMVRRSRR